MSQGPVLINPSEPLKERPWDNENFDLIVRIGDVMPSRSYSYEISAKLGSGTFGQVYRATCHQSGQEVAIKVVKNEAAYTNQAKVELAMLSHVNRRVDPDDRHHIVRLLDDFTHKQHLCLVFELLSNNLYELLKTNQFRGLSLNIVMVFVRQILEALILLREHKIIHCDLKPENVLLETQKAAILKLIDFGSSCDESRTVYTYIQSRFYRSPEKQANEENQASLGVYSALSRCKVLLGHKYTTAVDVWSLGCMAVELFIGIPLFPGASPHDVISLILHTIGWPPDSLLETSQDTRKFFSSRVEPGSTRKYRLRTHEEYQIIMQTEIKAPEKRYHGDKKLEDIICSYPYDCGAEDDLVTEKKNRESFLDVMKGMLDPNPYTRWTPKQALSHPFFLQKQLKGPFNPKPDPEIALPERVAETIRKTGLTGTAPFQSSPHYTLSPQEVEAHLVAMAAARKAMEHFSPQNGYMLANADGSNYMGMSLPQNSLINLPDSNGLAVPSQAQAGGLSIPAPVPIGRAMPSTAPAQAFLNPNRSQGSGIPIAQNPFSSGMYPPSSFGTSFSGMQADLTWHPSSSNYLQGTGRQDAATMSPYSPAMAAPIGINNQIFQTPSAAQRSGLPPGGCGPSPGGMLSPGSMMGSANSYSGAFAPSQSLQQVFQAFNQYGGVPPMPSNSLEQMRDGWHRPHNSLRFTGPSSLRGGNSTANPLQSLPSNGSIRSSYDINSLSYRQSSVASQQDLHRMIENRALPESNLRRQSTELPPLQGRPSHSGRTSVRNSLDWQNSHLVANSEPGNRRFSRMMSGELEVFPEPGDWDPGYSEDQLLSEGRARQMEGQNQRS